MKQQQKNLEKNQQIIFTNLSEVGQKLIGKFNGFIETKLGICILVDNKAMNVSSDLKKIISNNKELFIVGSKIEIEIIKIVKLKGRKTYKVVQVTINENILTSQTTNILDTNDLPF